MSETVLLLRRDQNRQAHCAYVPGVGFAPVLAAVDIVLLLALSAATGVLYHFFVYGDPSVALTYLPVGMLTAFFYVGVQALRKQYDITEIAADPAVLWRIFYAWNIAIFCMLFIGFAAKTMEVYSRGAFILFYCTGLFGLSLIRAATVSFVRLGFQKGWLASKHLFLLGTKERIHDFREQVCSARFGLHIADAETLPEAGKGECPKQFEARFAKALERVVEKTRSLNIDNIVLLIPWSESTAIAACRKAFQEVPTIPVLRLGPEFGRAFDIELSRIGPAVGLTLGRSPLDGLDTFLKRTMDLIISVTALIFLAPLLLVIAVLIKLDSKGPVLFRQFRHGFNREPFRIYKFRTMTVMEDGLNYRQACKNDPRVTRLGRFMRRWNIDELPQIVNVIKGEMSIVGPRPHPLVQDHEFQKRIALYARRHNVKPGITGWAQVNGYRGATDTDRIMRGRIEHDLYYIDNWSVWFDIQIILMTFFSHRAYQNAY